jgi:3'(2'), 5'-bisphosphate nucleotidase
MSKISIDRTLMGSIIDIARSAAGPILEVYQTNFTVQRKADQSPVTEADLAAHEVITASLSKLAQRWPVLSEESASIPFSNRALWHRYWLVDPLDGTRDFVKRNDEFSVNIALIEQNRPVLGVILAPVTGICYFAARGLGAHKWVPETSPTPIRVRRCSADRLTVAGSRFHRNPLTDAFIRNLGPSELLVMGSSLKSCLVAEGRADIYPRFGPTSEWDTAAAQCVVEEAGGHLTNTSFEPLRYNTRESLTNPPFLTFGDASVDWRSYLPQVGGD